MKITLIVWLGILSINTQCMDEQSVMLSSASQKASDGAMLKTICCVSSEETTLSQSHLKLIHDYKGSQAYNNQKIDEDWNSIEQDGLTFGSSFDQGSRKNSDSDSLEASYTSKIIKKLNLQSNNGNKQ